MKEFLQDYVLPNMSAIWGALFGAIAAIWGYIRIKPKEKLDNEGGNLENAKKSLEISERIADRLEKQLESSDSIIEQLKEKLLLALEEENTCKKALKAIREELAQFKVLFEQQKHELDGLKDECRLLRLTIEENEKNNTITDNLHAN